MEGLLLSGSHNACKKRSHSARMGQGAAGEVQARRVKQEEKEQENR